MVKKHHDRVFFALNESGIFLVSFYHRVLDRPWPEPPTFQLAAANNAELRNSAPNN